MGRLLLILTALAMPVVAADWSTLDRYQATITREDFDRLLHEVYCLNSAITNHLTYSTDSVTISTNFTLRFASSPIRHQPSPIRRIVLDPGHIGGEWARMEERWFQRGRDRPIQEAVLNLTVARLLKPKLEAAGFTVVLSKDEYQPVAAQRPEEFRAQAEQDVPANDDVANRADAVRKRMEILFYRSAEIAARAKRINDDLKPDLTVCLHFNAAPWDECQHLVEDNRLLLFVHGNYTSSEVADEDQRLRLFTKLLERSHKTELAVAEASASALAKATGLSAAVYPVPVGKTGYVYVRNLAANRLINGPVVYLEPYYMNNRIVYQRLQLGDYDGEKEIEGKSYRSIFREYADAVVEGLLSFGKPGTVP